MFKKLFQTKYLQPLLLTMTAILDAILDFSARTNFRQCIPLVSQTTDYSHFFKTHKVILLSVAIIPLMTLNIGAKVPVQTV